jgi:hypothetical protein
MMTFLRSRSGNVYGRKATVRLLPVEEPALCTPEVTATSLFHLVTIRAHTTPQHSGTFSFPLAECHNPQVQ